MFTFFVLVAIGLTLFVANSMVRKTPYEQGENAHIDGLKRRSNPYNGLTHKNKFIKWNKGYDATKVNRH